VRGDVDLEKRKETLHRFPSVQLGMKTVVHLIEGPRHLNGYI
jgi:hypothetical protein